MENQATDNNCNKVYDVSTVVLGTIQESFNTILMITVAYNEKNIFANNSTLKLHLLLSELALI